jgi:hypothetical protein
VIRPKRAIALGVSVVVLLAASCGLPMPLGTARVAGRLATRSSFGACQRV